MRVVSVVLACALVWPSTAGAADPEDAAAVAAVGLLGGGLLAQNLTRSKLSIQVDMFSDREAGGPFYLDKPAALQRALRKSTISLDEARALEAQLAPEMSRFQASLPAVEETARVLRGSGGFDALANEVSAQAGLARMALDAWDRFRSVVADPAATASTASAALTNLAAHLRTFADAPVSAALVDFLTTQIFAEMDQAALNAGVMVDTAELSPAFHADMRAAATAPNRTRQLEIAREATERLADAMLRAGVPLTRAELIEEAQVDELARRFALQESQAVAVLAAPKARANEAASVIYNAFLNQPNFGPIVNEALQQVLAQAPLDVVMDPRNERYWRKGFAEAVSTAGTGNHNVVIYLENLATPVLKKATFDPSDFIRANALMYRRAFGLSADLFGLPTAGEGETPSATPNLFELRRQRSLARREAQNTQRALISGMVRLQQGSRTIRDAGSAAALVREVAATLGDPTVGEP